MKILIVGVTGMLGRSLYNLFCKDYNVYGIGKSNKGPLGLINYHQVDISNFQELHDYLKNKSFDVVINAAAIIDHSYCEKNPELCFRVNAEVNEKLIQSLNPTTKFIFISSDAVFSDEDKRRDEEGGTNPISIYGKSKLKAEKLIQEKSNNYVIIRTTIVGFSPRKNSLTDWLLKHLEINESLNLFDDVIFNPITVWDISTELQFIIHNFDLFKNHILHVNGKDCVSKYEFGMSIAKKLNTSTTKITRGSLNDFEYKGDRVYNQYLDIQKYVSMTNREIPDLDSTINSIIKNLNQ